MGVPVLKVHVLFHMLTTTEKSDDVTGNKTYTVYLLKVHVLFHMLTTTEKSDDVTGNKTYTVYLHSESNNTFQFHIYCNI